MQYNCQASDLSILGTFKKLFLVVLMNDRYGIVFALGTGATKSYWNM